MILIRVTNTRKLFLYLSMALNVFALCCKEQTCSKAWQTTRDYIACVMSDSKNGHARAYASITSTGNHTCFGLEETIQRERHGEESHNLIFRVRNALYIAPTEEFYNQAHFPAS